MSNSIKIVSLPILARDEHGVPPAAELLPSRRGFLRGLAASMALAGMYGCSKRPKETIVPYVSQPEQMVPGEPLFFATTLTLGGYGRGVIVTSREGRPIKIEGNPDHAAGVGSADVFMQAAVLDLYDPARSKTVTRGGAPATWSNFVEALGTQLAAPSAGQGLRLLSGNISSPTELRLIENVLKKFPGARWHAHEPLDRQNTRAGAALAFGRPLEPVYRVENLRVVVAVDSDFLIDQAGSLAFARGFATSHQLHGASAQMARMYSVESSFSITGTKADHRRAVRPGEAGAFVFALAAALGIDTGAGPAGAFDDQKFVDAVADDLKASQASGAVIVGERQPPAVHAVAHQINDLLGSYGHAITMAEPFAKGGGSGAGTIETLTADMAAGRVTTLLIIGGNPARTAPAGQGFVDQLAKLSTVADRDGQLKNVVAHLGLYADETAYNCQWHVPGQHVLESWGDARAFDGTASIIQPLIAPLYDGHATIDVLNVLLGEESTTAYESTRATWRSSFSDSFDERWSAALQRGTIAAAATVPLPRAVKTIDASTVPAVSPLAAGTVDIVFAADPSVHDGQFFHNAWLQELPRPLTKICWGNAAIISPKTADAFGLADGDVIRLTHGGRSIEIAALALPGHANDVVTLHLGYGRYLLTNTPVDPSGGPGSDVFGVDVYPLRSDPHTLSGVVLERTGRTEKIVRTHGHHAMASHKGDDASVQAMLTPVVIATPGMSAAELKLHNRKIIRTATLDQYKIAPDFAQQMEEKRTLSLYEPWDYSSSPQWGMTIDLTTCIGCNACTIACQAENNIPVVGPEGVDREREMHWIRIDSYFADDDQVYHQPVPCMHCENAPCEYVCPVAATSHSTDGLNQMTYNRCVGTRYCSNNCPYKVRRFNFFNYTIDTPASVALQHNPDVTVRSLGVMEKCTYCVQRLEYTKRKSEIAGLDAKLKQGDAAAAKIENDLLGRVQTACQQTCPTQAISFGNIADLASDIAISKQHPRNYGLLNELTTKPRTTYLAHVSNPNAAIAGGRA